MCPTSVFFNNFGSNQEQNLIENLIIESIKIYGHDVYYIPRSLINKDEIYGEDSISEYNDSFFIDMYIKDVNGFQGEGDFLSKFNLQIRDQITFTLAKRIFFDEIGSNTAFERPREGDLIYLPLNKKVFIIKFVEHEAIFYQLGSLQTYDLQCELWEYSNEILNTGISDIDILQKTYSFDMSQYSMLTEDKYVLKDEDGFDLVQEQYDFTTQVGDSFEDNFEIETEADSIVDFSEIDPFSEGNY
jgi:hypothetical protein